MAPIARILDANANRAREAMRVMEDAARFGLNASSLSRELKILRHDFRSVLDRLPDGWLEANRDTPGDVGTTHTTKAEGRRENFAEVVIAAGKRLTESLRVIEEAGKSIDVEFSERIESIRYRAYDLEARVQRQMGTGRARQWSVCVLLTVATCRKPWREVLAQSLESGADCIQLREKEMGDQALTEHVQEVIEEAHRIGASVIVNDRVDVALASGADGVHVGQGDLSVAQVRAIVGRSLLVGVSTHDLQEARGAVEAGADYCGVGAMFSTALKPERTPSGPAYFASFIEHHPGMPHLAIGGITPGNMDELVTNGCRGVAVSSEICHAEDPGSVVRQLRNAVEQSQTIESTI